MKKQIMSSTLVIVIGITGVLYALGREWSPVIESDGIRVSARTMPHSEFREYQAEMVLDEAVSVVLAVLDDIPAAVQWFPFCIFAAVMDEQADGQRTIVNVSDFPWPFQDRYVVFNSASTRDYIQKEVFIDFESVDAANVQSFSDLIKTDTMVRINVVRGQWVLSVIDRKTTKVTYTVYADPGGNIPKWLVKTFFEDAPYRTLKNMRQFVKKSEYQKAPMTEQDRQGFGFF